MRGVRAEMAESLEDNEMNLGDFSTNTRDGSESGKKTGGTNQGELEGDPSAANSNVANQTIVKHGSSVSAVA